MPLAVWETAIPPGVADLLRTINIFLTLPAIGLAIFASWQYMKLRPYRGTPQFPSDPVWISVAWLGVSCLCLGISMAAAVRFGEPVSPGYAVTSLGFPILVIGLAGIIHSLGKRIVSAEEYQKKVDN